MRRLDRTSARRAARALALRTSAQARPPNPRLVRPTLVGSSGNPVFGCRAQFPDLLAQPREGPRIVLAPSTRTPGLVPEAGGDLEPAVVVLVGVDRLELGHARRPQAHRGVVKGCGRLRVKHGCCS